MTIATTSIDSTAGVGRATGKQSISLAVLYRIERWYLSLLLNSLKRHSQASEDAWWISEGSEVRGPVRFAEVLRTVLDESATRGVVHHSRISEEPAPWQAITYQPWWSNRLIARFWTVSFWFFWALLGWVLLDIAMPRVPHKARDIVYWLTLLSVTGKRQVLRAWFLGIGGKIAQRRFRVLPETRR